MANTLRKATLAAAVLSLCLASCGSSGGDRPVPAPAQPVSAANYRIPGTGQKTCYSATASIDCPKSGERFAGQDASSGALQPSLRSNGDGTVTDLITGLTWASALAGPMSWDEARSSAALVRTGGFSDWRLPDIHELYTLIDFGLGYFGPNAALSTPFIDTARFEFAYTSGERFFDVQQWSTTRYVATTMNGDDTVFGVNFADGRIKGYPRFDPASGGTRAAQMRVRYVRGDRYGQGELRDNRDGTATDLRSSLVWQAIDDGRKRDWEAALSYCDNLTLGGKSDWRLPDAKELHSIVDYTKAPAATGGPALRAPLRATETESYFWTSTTAVEGPPDQRFGRAVYFAFGRALGWMETPPGSGTTRLLDVHGAGAQRADFKVGDPALFPNGFGPQGDDVRIAMFSRCVRGRAA